MVMATVATGRSQAYEESFTALQYQIAKRRVRELSRPHVNKDTNHKDLDENNTEDEQYADVHAMGEVDMSSIDALLQLTPQIKQLLTGFTDHLRVSGLKPKRENELMEHIKNVQTKIEASLRLIHYNVQHASQIQGQVFQEGLRKHHQERLDLAQAFEAKLRQKQQQHDDEVKRLREDAKSHQIELRELHAVEMQQLDERKNDQLEKSKKEQLVWQQRYEKVWEDKYFHIREDVKKDAEQELRQVVQQVEEDYMNVLRRRTAQLDEVREEECFTRSKLHEANAKIDSLEEALASQEQETMRMRQKFVEAKADLDHFQHLHSNLMEAFEAQAQDNAENVRSLHRRVDSLIQKHSNDIKMLHIQKQQDLNILNERTRQIMEKKQAMESQLRAQINELTERVRNSETIIKQVEQDFLDIIPSDGFLQEKNPSFSIDSDDADG